MVVKEFSNESVKLAEAALLLGLDCVERYEKYRLNRNHSIDGVRFTGINKSLDISRDKFPELDVGDNISLQYITAFEDCNMLYKKHNMYQSETA